MDEHSNSFESPFVWNIPDQIDHQSDWMVTKPVERLDNMVDDPGFKWFRYTKLIMLMYEHFTRQNKTKAFHYMKLCEDVLLEPDNQSDPFYKSIEKSLWHVFLATKLGLISQGNAADEDLIQSIVCKITPVSDMNSEEKAGVLGIKSSVVMCYGPEIGVQVLGTIREAIQLSPNQAEWHHVEGRILLARQRGKWGVFNKKNRECQFQAFKRAYELNRNNASYVIKYAIELKHKANNVGRENHVDFYRQWNEVVNLFEYALELRPTCPYHLCQVAKGFSRFPYSFKNLAKFEKLLLKAEQRAPKHYFLLREIGHFYDIDRGDLTKACEYYEKAINEGSYRAAFDLIKAKMKLTNEEFDPIPILEQVRYKFYEKDRKAECVMQMGTYHFFVTKDYESALSYFSEFMEHYPNTKFLKAFNPMYLHLYCKPISLLKLLHHFILTEDTTGMSSEQTCKRDAILNQVYRLDPDLRGTAGTRDYLDKIFDNREDMKARYEAKRERMLLSYSLQSDEMRTQSANEHHDTPSSGQSRQMYNRGYEQMPFQNTGRKQPLSHENHSSQGDMNGKKIYAERQWPNERNQRQGQWPNEERNQRQARNANENIRWGNNDGTRSGNRNHAENRYSNNARNQSNQRSNETSSWRSNDPNRTDNSSGTRQYSRNERNSNGRDTETNRSDNANWRSREQISREQNQGRNRNSNDQRNWRGTSPAPEGRWR
ncbi:hypothetical protein M8J75_009247 [Diaphorina citri]|nr:hypothetical protein M8J75_009247 [Diaphorina citri]